MLIATVGGRFVAFHGTALDVFPLLGLSLLPGELAHLRGVEHLGEFEIAVRPRAWTDEHVGGGRGPTHAYRVLNEAEAGLRWILDRYGRPRDALDIGSELFQVIAESVLATALTFVDIRRPLATATDLGATCWIGSACALPPEWTDRFDVVTSSCVLCHAGDGRYDDTFNPIGDRAMLAEMARVLAPGGRLLLMPGPMCSDPRPLLMYNEHRVYTFAWMREALARVGLRVTETAVYGRRAGWCAESECSAMTDGVPWLPDFGMLGAVKVRA